MIDYSSFQEYYRVFSSLSGRKHGMHSIDLFIFSYDFPFENMKDVVIGRYYVDNYIMIFCHNLSIPIADLTEIPSFHQGLEHCSRNRSNADNDANAPFLGPHKRDDILLIPSHVVL